MTNYHPNENQTNNNTSYLSELQSSMMSSVCGPASTSSLNKLQELKVLYSQTCREEQQLKEANINLHKELEFLKEKLEQMIEAKFGTQRTIRKVHNVSNVHNQEEQIRTQKNMRPGSITKTKKSKKNLPFAMPAQDSPLSPTFASKGLKFEIDDNQDEERQSVKRDNLNYKKSKPEKKINFNQCRDSLFNIWEQQSPRNFHNDQIIRKSYLSSPRASALQSPRSYLE